MAALLCPSPEQLRAFHLGDLPEGSLDQVAQHLDVCPRCETLARQLDTQVDPILEAIRAPAAAAGTQRLVAQSISPRPPAATGRYPFLQPAAGSGDLGRLGNYRILRLLGAGGMGFVFHAEDLMLRRGLALKVMKPSLTPDADGWQRFLREARLMASIKHRHLATVYQAGEENGVVYLAMELLEGETLATRLDRVRRLEVPEILRVGQEIAAGLAVVHAQGLVHRDIKPDNIWLEADGDNVKILDFGLARCIRDKARLTQTGLIMGTPAYMSPEQAAGRPVDPRSDLFSLGALLYRACSGHEPFEGHNTMAVLAALAVATPRPLHEIQPAIPKALSDLISRLLARDPNQRPGSAAEVVEEFAALAAGGSRQRMSAVHRPVPVAAASVAPAAAGRSWKTLPGFALGKSSRGGRASRALWLGAAAALALLLSAIVWACWPPHRGRPHQPQPYGPEYSSPVAGPIEPVNPADDNREVVYLTELMPAGHEQWLPVIPRPPDAPRRPGDEGKIPVVERGQTSPHGIFMHGPPPHLGGGPASITYRLPGQFRAFEADVSLNDGPPHSDTAITFSVYDGAGKLLWRSMPVFSQEDAQHISVPLEKVEVLKLEIRCASREVRGAHAVWIEPRLKR